MPHYQKTVGIITIDDYTNYGNRLQNYALTKLLETEGFRVINGIQAFTKEDWINRTKSPVKKIIKKVIPFCKVRKKIYFQQPVWKGLLQERQKRFLEFTTSYTKIIDPIISANHRQVNKALEIYGIDYYVTGSDQVWNPHYQGNEYEFLTFAPKKKRLSFAASIGVENIPEDAKWYFGKNLSDMEYISVREERAAQIVEELTGRVADVTLDPTLLLDRTQWEIAAKKPQLDIEEQYICTYFLGEVPEAVTKFAEKVGLKVYSLNSENDKTLFTIDPAEFLYMIKNATYVLTDSFHAVAFSIKFNKEFYVFDRKQDGVNNMFSRIETITSRFNLTNRIQNRSKIIEQALIDNWNEIESELIAEKNKSIQRLLKAMEIKHG